jgi:spore germination protein GerM
VTARGGGVLAVVAVAVLAGGCWDSDEKAPEPPPPPPARTSPGGSQTSYRADFWRPVVSSDCADRLASPPRRGRLYVFFSCEPRTGPFVNAAAARELAAEDATPTRAVRVLLGGPTRAERAARFFSTFGPKTADLPFEARIDEESGLATVDLDRSILKVEFAFVSLQEVAQITSTVGQFPAVKRVEIRIGGQSLCAALGEC